MKRMRLSALLLTLLAPSAALASTAIPNAETSRLAGPAEHAPVPHAPSSAFFSVAQKFSRVIPRFARSAAARVGIVQARPPLSREARFAIYYLAVDSVVHDEASSRGTGEQFDETVGRYPVDVLRSLPSELLSPPIVASINRVHPGANLVVTPAGRQRYLEVTRRDAIRDFEGAKTAAKPAQYAQYVVRGYPKHLVADLAKKDPFIRAAYDAVYPSG